MSNGQGKQLTSRSIFGKMLCDIMAIIKQRNCYGVLYYPTMKNPAIVITHRKDSISQLDVLFEEVKHDENGIPILPENKVTYRSE